MSSASKNAEMNFDCFKVTLLKELAVIDFQWLFNTLSEKALSW